VIPVPLCEPSQKGCFLLRPRGFCAGVDRAIQIVEQALASAIGAPVYVRHEIVHNRYVVEGWRPRARSSSRNSTRSRTTAPVIFSAHGVPKAVPARPSAATCSMLDATCPLVSKVHREAERHAKRGPDRSC
jgi:4-hydroxy-3-methylbut-2-en-1-yl diphosphate reductase